MTVINVLWYISSDHEIYVQVNFDYFSAVMNILKSLNRFNSACQKPEECSNENQNMTVVVVVVYKGTPTKNLLCRKHEWKKERIVASATCFSLCGKVDILNNSLL